MTYYCINVTKTAPQGNPIHLFATAERSLRSAQDAQECWRLFKAKFPESEGYGLDMQYWEHTGRCVNPETMELE